MAPSERRLERQNRPLLKRMRIAQAEGKQWKEEVRKYLIAYRSIPHTTTGVSPAEPVDLLRSVFESYCLLLVYNL